jgi:hypothetical protein
MIDADKRKKEIPENRDPGMISKSIRIIQILSRRHTQERQRFRTHIF